MFSIVNATNQFLSNLSALEQRINTVNNEVSSGLAVQQPSDNPDSVSAILQVNAQIAHNNQIKTNLSQVQTEVNVAENAINTATTLMDTAGQIATEASSNSSDVDRTQLQAQVKDIITEMQQLANTQVSGRYVFAGDSDQTAPYGAVDLTTNTTNAVGTYQGNNGSRYMEDPYGSTLQISLTAQTIFDGGTSGTTSTSVFQSLTELYNALGTNSISAAVQAASDLTSSANYLNQQQSIYGDFQNSVTNALNAQSTVDTNLKAQLSNLQDADEAQVIVQQQTDSTALTAAETAYASLPKKSLFDYLG